MKITKTELKNIIKESIFDDILGCAKGETNSLCEPSSTASNARDYITSNTISSGDGTFTTPVDSDSWVSNGRGFSPGGHGGQDWSRAEGTPIYAIADGTVTKVYEYDDTRCDNLKDVYGNMMNSAPDKGGCLNGHGVSIDHGEIDGDSVTSQYIHMKMPPEVGSGDTVSKGDIIGYVGTTGQSTGPHLHFQIKKNGDKVDPINFIANLTPPDSDVMVAESTRETHNKNIKGNGNKMTTTEQQIRAHIREAIKEVKESLESTEKYDDHTALKGDQDELPDVLQKGIIDNAREEKEKSENAAIAEGRTMTNETTEQQIREHIRATIKEIQEEKHAQDVNPLSEPEHLSEARQHIRNAINEVMVGMTPITRMPTQEDANNAKRGEDTNTAIDKAELGFNTFNMQEWASIAGIDTNDLSEALDDDTGNSSMLGGSDAPLDNVVDIADASSDSADEIPGMVVSAVSGDSAWDDGLEDEVEDLADEYLANRAEPDVFDIRDFLAEIRKR